MTDSTNDLSFSDYNGGKVVGTHAAASNGNGLLNKSLKKVIIPATYLGVRVIEIGNGAFEATKIESVFIPRYVKTITYDAFWN